MRMSGDFSQQAAHRHIIIHPQSLKFRKIDLNCDSFA